MASNYRAAQGGRTGGREYTRDHATPAWEALEEVAGELEGGEAVAFGSGMAAVAAVLDLVPAGALVVAPTDCYMGVPVLLADGQEQGRWRAEFVDVTDTAGAAAAARHADLVWLESPTNPLLDVADLRALCSAAHAGGALVAVDNAFATPLLQQPLRLGADIAMHSATKFFGGFSDLLMGIAVGTARSSASGCAAAGSSPAPSPARWRPSSCCVACALCGCGWSRASAAPGGLARRAGGPSRGHPGAVSRPGQRPWPRAGRRAR